MPGDTQAWKGWKREGWGEDLGAGSAQAFKPGRMSRLYIYVKSCVFHYLHASVFSSVQWG